MSQSARQELVAWINGFEYPHCSEASSISELRSGIALCQLIYDVVLNRQQPRLLQQVVISQVGRKQSVGNLALALQHVRRAGQRLPLPNTLEKITAEQLYEQPAKLKLLVEYLRLYSQIAGPGETESMSQPQRRSSLPKRPPLPRQRSTNPQPATEHASEMMHSNRMEQAATSFISIGPNNKRGHLDTSANEFIRSSVKRTELEDQSPIKYNIEDPVSPRTKSTLVEWLCDIHLIKPHPNLQQELPNVCRGGMIFIDLLNWLSGKQVVLTHTTAKQTDKQAAQAVYRKVLKYLSKFERMNPRYLLSSRELADGNDDLFWGLLDDIYHWHLNKVSRFDRRYWRMDSSSKKPAAEHTMDRKRSDSHQNSSKQGLEKYRSTGNAPEEDRLSQQRASTKNLPTQASQAKLPKDTQPNKQNVKPKLNFLLDEEEVQAIYQWLRKQGFSHSLEKSLKLAASQSPLKDPLRNGTLLGSVVQRLQICKLNLIKEPQTDKHISHNFQEINRNCLRRALGLTAINPPYSTASVLMFLQKLMKLNLHPRPTKPRQLQDVSKIREIPLELKEWLDQLEVTDVRRQFSRIATSVVRVDYCKQMTQKIRYSNISKVLQYLKKIGMVQYLPVTCSDVLDEQNDVVWQLLQDIYALKFNQQ